MIDLIATRENFRKTGRTMAGWARANDFVGGTVQGLFQGVFPTTGKTGQKIVEALRADGLLVECEDREAA